MAQDNHDGVKHNDDDQRLLFFYPALKVFPTLTLEAEASTRQAGESENGGASEWWFAAAAAAAYLHRSPVAPPSAQAPLH